ncbi:MAG: methyltransferase domain-containing protein [Verrucomicrobiia bacterium]
MLRNIKRLFFGKNSNSHYKKESKEEIWKEIAKKKRCFASYHYIRGEGIEIGGLHQPLKTYHGAKVCYVDRLSTKEVQQFYSDVVDQPKVTVDLVDDGERLAKVADESCDFVIANHVIEHCRNPIGAIFHMLRVLKPEGVLYLAIPDKRFTFDRDRKITPFEHLKRDYEEGPEVSDREHYEEWLRVIERVKDHEKLQRRIEKYIEKQVNIHFHVWTQCEILEMFLRMKQDYHFPIEMEFIEKNGLEIIVVVRKAAISN